MSLSNYSILYLRGSCTFTSLSNNASECTFVIQKFVFINLKLYFLVV